MGFQTFRLPATVFAAFGLASCAVGPGTPLVDALNPEATVNTSVPAPEGYRTSIATAESSGLINPVEREATQAYLEALAND